MIKVRSRTKGITICEADEAILTRRYFSRCLHFTSCKDACCSYGCPLDIAERDRVYVYASELEKAVGHASSDWFEPEIVPHADFPSGQIQRTKVYDGKCVFFDHVAGGCHLHRLAMRKHIDWRMLKPMACSLFPITWESHRLLVSEFLDELPCRDQGVAILDAQKEHLAFYFGEGLVAELQNATRAIAGSGRKTY